MNTTGEYAQPLSRTTGVQFPVVNGYTTARLRAKSDPATQAGAIDQTVQVLLENVGAASVTLQLYQATVYDAVSSDPTRDATTLGASKTLVPGGRVTYSVVLTKRYLEVKCTAGGPSNVRLQLSGLVEFQELGFDKIKDDSLYPKELWQAKIPAWSTLSPP